MRGYGLRWAASGKIGRGNMIEQATGGDLQALAHLWRDCFGDTDDYPERFLRVCMQTAGCFVLCERERDGIPPRAMACVLSASVRGREELQGAYLYALCTRADCRRRGIAGSLIEWAKAHFDFLFLIPANEALAHYYREKGFSCPLWIPIGFAENGKACGGIVPALRVHPAFAALAEEALSPSPDAEEETARDDRMADPLQTARDFLPSCEKKQEKMRKIYEMCCTDRVQSVIMVESGLGYGCLTDGMCCGILPV